MRHLSERHLSERLLDRGHFNIDQENADSIDSTPRISHGVTCASHSDPYTPATGLSSTASCLRGKLQVRSLDGLEADG